MPSPSETLDRVTVRLVVTHDDQRQWDEFMCQWHYLKSGRMVGEQLRYVAEVNGVWVALLGWSAATLKSAPRRAWIGWSLVQERQRLHLLAQNSRFLMLPGNQVPNLASRILALNGARLSADWQAEYGHPVWLAETFVDQERFQGTCYRAAGWEEIGTTKGVRRDGTNWVRHGVIKRLLVKELCPDARTLLKADQLPDDRTPLVTPHEIRLDGDTGLLKILRTLVPDPRRRKGRRFPSSTLLALLIAGMLAGMNHVEHIAAWARNLPDRILKRFGCPLWPGSGKRRVPCANTFRYFVQDLDPLHLDRAVRAWLNASDITTAGMVIAIDGKSLRGSAHLDTPARKLVSMFLTDLGITIVQRDIPDSTSEVPVVREMLADPDLVVDGAVITTDAAHTCAETAEAILKKTPTFSWSSRATNPTWRLRWANMSKPHRPSPIPPDITDMATVAMKTAP